MIVTMRMAAVYIIVTGVVYPLLLRSLSPPQRLAPQCLRSVSFSLVQVGKSHCVENAAAF